MERSLWEVCHCRHSVFARMDKKAKADRCIVITSIFTFAVTIYTIIIYHRNNPFAGHGKAFTFARLGVEALVFLLWIASATLMLRPKSGCHPRNPPGNPDACFNGNHDSHPKKWADQPLITWDIAIGFSFVEM